MKKILIALGVVVVVGGSYYLLDDESPAKPESIKQWERKYPRLVNNVGFGKIEEPESFYTAKPAAEKDLIGKVTNEFGIRDEVLQLILTTIPESDVQSTIAMIKMVQYDQQQIGVTDDKEMNLIANKAAAASSCIDIPMMDRSKFGDSYDELIRDTPARKYEWNRIEMLLNHHVISPDYGINSYDFKEQCAYFLGESHV